MAALACHATRALSDDGVVRTEYYNIEREKLDYDDEMEPLAQRDSR